MSAVIGWKTVLFVWVTKLGAELKLSRHLPIYTISDHFSDFSRAFFVNLNSEKFRNKRAGK